MFYEDYDNPVLQDHNGDDVYSKPVRAGKRTYFFDVKATKGQDYYLTITESKRRIEKDGRYVYDKHKIFLYKEDFEKFNEGLKEVVDYIKAHCNVIEARNPEERSFDPSELSGAPDVSTPQKSFSDVDFDEL
ncbi:MAG: PUR family DNA/RNA-binding protein [Bacteroidales bacterium]|nr:PUR family DNA/RNA-binding protein [Bacteroidales bacterium]